MSEEVPQISLEVVGGPMDGARYVGGKPEVFIGRAQTGKERRPNDIVLAKDNYCSRGHARVYFEDGQWLLQDLGSTSFTRVHGKTLDGSTPPEVLVDLDYIIPGNTVVEFRVGSRDLPPAIPKDKALVSGATKKLLDRANQQASKAMAHFVGVEHLFWAIADSEIPIVVEFFSGAKLEPKEVSRQTLEFDRWTGANAWIGTMLHSTTSFKPSSIVETPRLDYLFTLADEARKRTDDAMIEPMHMLVAILQEGGSVPVELLSQLGLECRVLATMAMRLITASRAAKAAPAAPPREEPKASAEAPTPPPMPSQPKAKAREPAPQEASSPPPPPQPVAPPPKPERKVVEQAVWLQAREMMDALVATQVQFQLAEPAARFEALRAKVREKVAGLPGPKRQAVFEQLRVLFPVVETAAPFVIPAMPEPQDEQDTPSQGTPRADDEDLDGTRGGKGKKGGKEKVEKKASIRDIFATNINLSIDKTGGQANVEALSQIFFQFALAVEQFSTGVVQTLHGGSSGESKYYLPFMTSDLRGLMKKAETGNPEAVEAVRNYLSDLQRWQVSLITAFQKSADKWNEQIWERIKPETIRRDSGLGAAMAKFSPGTLWATYEKKVRDLHPEVTADEFRQLVDSMANQEFRKLGKPGK